MELFGPYRLEAVLGQGGMGDVFRAYDTRRERTVAVKRLRPELAAESGYQERFRRECTYAARLSSPHVVPIHDFGELDGQLYLDMRLVQGTDLRKLLASTGPLSPVRAVTLIGQVADALDCAHEAGLVHRDVKPSNVLVAGVKERDFCYLTDFGIVRATNGSDSSLTATGKAIGTLTYMAPELFTGGAQGKEVDVYALGCLLFEAMTGAVPFKGEGAELMYRHLNDPPPRLSAARPELGEAFDAVIARAMAKAPDDRFPSAGALAEAADQALARRTGPTAQAPTAHVSPISEDATSALTIERASPPTRVLQQLLTARPRSTRAKILTASGTVAAVAAVAVGALLYPSQGVAPRSSPAASPSRPTLSGTMTRISVTVPPGWHEVPFREHPTIPQMVYPVTCDAIAPGCSIGLARIITSHAWENTQKAAASFVADLAKQPGVLSVTTVSEQSVKVGSGGYDGYQIGVTFRNPYANHIGRAVAVTTGPPDWTGRPEISRILIWLHTDEPAALDPTVIDQIINSVRKQEKPINNPFENWFNNGGKHHLDTLGGDATRTSAAFGKMDYPAAERAGEEMQKDVAQAQAYPPFPDTQGQAHWAAHLDHLARGAAHLIAAARNNDNAELQAGSTEVKASTDELRKFNDHLRDLPF